MIFPFIFDVNFWCETRVRYAQFSSWNFVGESVWSGMYICIRPMENADKITVPLTQDEHSFLMTVYRKRRSIFLKAYALLIPMILYYSLSSRQAKDGYVYNLSGEAVSERVPTGVKYVVNFLVLGSAVFGVGIYTYRTRILSLKKDADSWEKERIACGVTRKE